MNRNRKSASHHTTTLKNHAKELVHATSHITDAGVSEARNRLSQIIDTISEKIEDAEEAALEKGRQADEYVRENPYQTAGITLGLGLILGYLLSRRAK